MEEDSVAKMTRKEIVKTPLDEDFRRICTSLINEAKDSIYVIAGELGSLKAPDMQYATVQAVAQRNVKGYAYATHLADKSIKNYAVTIGCKLYIGEKYENTHYLVVDGKHTVQSDDKRMGQNTKVGTRQGWVYYDEPEKARKTIKKFEELKQQAAEVNTIDKAADPFYQLITN